MIRECGLYVLMGSKPMVSFSVKSGIPETEEEYKEHYPRYISYLKENHPKDTIPSYEEYKNASEENAYMLDARLWENWKAKMKDYVGPNFQFVVRKMPFGEGNVEGLFLNKCSTLYLLTRYYREFEQVYGASFEPKKVLNEISEENSGFWECVFRNHYTQGLLFGYGPRNSYFFDWQSENNFPFPRRFFQDVVPFVNKKIKVSDLRLPIISMYFLGDDVLENYKLQRQEILAEFANKDFETTVKKWLGVGLHTKTGI